MSELQSTALELAQIEAMMTTKNLDQPGNHQTALDRGGVPAARHTAAVAKQSAAAKDLAGRTVAAASGSVPAPIKKG